MEAIVYDVYETQYGTGLILFQNDRVKELHLPLGDRYLFSQLSQLAKEKVLPTNSRSLLAQRVEEYFRGQRVEFDDVKVYDEDYPELRKLVFEALRKVKYGESCSYGYLAHATFKKTTPRAIGSIMSSNRVPLVIPCHRVIMSDGRLGGYGPDPEWKKRLLEMEGVRVKD
ncbi:methylated-DNA-[protein]-cysteine S-methyltransferase [Candidatus Hakubella thermalkaliphila]|uniref:Methylated-DNA-[protein]-cysteine S-methyltransferase n=1 Tax=Candidatus Hakubella thermalkaliphila TaxID=2754717 RepID=A0A6V8NLN1_9ACTN|nr:methylated-DNA--[protein]-cysteine S-methyltransferase [Candidatus Hakubella thermalkaliphila]GFP21145.1 methylated-DNA-[protein]-cysteine S-methyltransferase [Candidatus Hakubella thermalkaliphila]